MAATTIVRGPGRPDGVEAPEGVGDLLGDVPRVHIGLRMGASRRRQIGPPGPEALDDDGVAGHQDDLAEGAPGLLGDRVERVDEGEAAEELRKHHVVAVP